MVMMAIALIMQCNVAMAADAPSPAPASGSASSYQASLVAGLVVSENESYDRHGLVCPCLMSNTEGGKQRGSYEKGVFRSVRKTVGFGIRDQEIDYRSCVPFLLARSLDIDRDWPHEKTRHKFLIGIFPL
ncbi:unnamed protein product [Sphagnum troendelagicum]|uniref:Uncharacterized protein n=1 Tax=Sphagnum jensenii TaxID=128206 RepID=A0ABP0XCH8_9BRYO